MEFDGRLPLLPEVYLPPLTAGSLDGWGWRDMKVLLVPWYDGLARLLTKLEGVGALAWGPWMRVLP